MDGRINNKGVTGNSGGWPSLDRKMWQDLKNEAIKQAFEALSGDDKPFKQKIILQLLGKINIDDSDRQSIATFIIKEHGDNTVPAEQVAEDSSTGQV
jgi:hypothetical protein